MNTLDRKQLRKMFLVALSSDQPGEAMAALGKIRGALAKAGLDIHWLADIVAGEAPKPLREVFREAWANRPVPTVDWKDMLHHCDANSSLLRKREKEFVESLLEQWAGVDDWYPTVRQLQWLGDIYTRLTRRPQHA